MGNYKLYKEIGISIEEIYNQIRYIEHFSGQKVPEIDASLDIIESRCNIVIDNKMQVFDDRELIELRKRLDEALSAEVSSKLYRSLAAIKKRTETMYKKLPFIYHGVIIGPIKLSVLESFVVMFVAIASIIVFQLI